MATVKIILEEHECIEEVEDSLHKALSSKVDFTLDEKRFDDPLMNELSEEVDQIYMQNYSRIIKDIVDVLKEGM